MTPRAWLYGTVGAVLGALLLTVAVQQARIGSLRASLAEAEARVATERAERVDAARRHAEILSAAQAAHATRQQEAEHAWTLEKARLDAGRRDDADLVRRLRAQIAAALSAGSGTTRPADPAAPERGGDPAPDLAGLLGEGVALVAEGRRLVEQRDGEVTRLLAQITADRAACAAGGGSGASRPTSPDPGH
ncbi:MAG: hypothetical protein RIS35_3738 [Pseudomonadota bacterium]|jgi:hypothetical protein